MTKRTFALSVIVAAFAIGHEPVKSRTISFTGTVVDTGCYVSHNSKGPDHRSCAETCAKNGVPLAVLDDKGTLFLPIAVEHKDQNTKLMPFIEKKVKVTGALMQKGGLKGIAIKTVEAAQ